MDEIRSTLSDGECPNGFRWPIGAKVRKKRGSQWRGTVCGFYSTPHTPEGYCVDSAFETGSVQVWPAAALEDWDTGWVAFGGWRLNHPISASG